MQFFPAAPWSRTLQVISGFSTLLLLSVGFFARKAAPPIGAAHAVGTAVAWVPAAVVLGALLWIVNGYEIDATHLRIRRLLWTTTLRVEGVKRIWRDEDVIRGSVRVFGNGGLFAFCGVYWSKRLGRYRLFATDLKPCVVLVLSDRTVVVSPADPDRFIEHARATLPSI